MNAVISSSSWLLQPLKIPLTCHPNALYLPTLDGTWAQIKAENIHIQTKGEKKGKPQTKSQYILMMVCIFVYSYQCYLPVWV